MHTRTHRDRDACLDGCTHSEVDSYIIEVDKIVLKDDCENECHLRLGCNSKKTAPHYTNVQMLADTCTDKPAHTLACRLRT